MGVPAAVKIPKPKIWAGSGVPLCCTRTQRWEGSREGKTQEKQKKATAEPCWEHSQFGEHEHWDGPCKGSGFGFADPALPCVTRCHQQIPQQQ